MKAVAPPTLVRALPSAGSPSTKPTAIDIFCGAGGLSEGLKQAGFRVVGAIDIEPEAVATYRFNQRQGALWSGDVRGLTADAVLAATGLKAGELDLVAGCPPCQGFSRIRTRNRKSRRDDRNTLVDEFCRLVEGLKPKAVMMENVPRMGTYPGLQAMVKRLRAAGYRVTQGIVDAADYGVPQRRKRFILLATRLRTRLAIPAGETKRVTVHDAIHALPKPGRAGDPLHRPAPKRAQRIKDLIARIPRDGGSRLDLPTEYQLECHKNHDGFKDVYGRMAWRDVSPTITGGCINPSKGRFLHPTQNRAITLREAALLQSFPPSYHFGLSRGTYAAATMIGNALPPVMIRKIGRHVAAHLKESVHAA